MKPSFSKLTKAEMATFASGDMFGGGASVIISFFYLIFLTDVVQLRPILAGTLILVSKIWDAVNDPLMGFITDNTRTRWGRRRPYFLIGSLSIVVAFFLLWYPISSDSELVKFLYVLFAYILYSSVSTMVMIPYAAMASEITTDFKERNQVNGARLLFSQVASLICAVVPLEIVKLFSGQDTGYMVMALTFGIFFSIPFLLIFFFTNERVTVQAEKSKFSIAVLTAPFKVRSFRFLIVIYLFSFLSMDVVSTVFAYFMNYYLKRPSELNYVLGAMLITQIFLVPVVVKLANTLGKAKTYMLHVLVWGLGILFLTFLGPDWPSWAIYVNAVIMGMGIVGGIVIPWIMYPDITDVGELAFGKRNSGSFGGIMTFMRSLSSAFGIFIISTILDLAGYLKPVEQVVDGVTKKVLVEQPDAVILSLKLIVTAFPVVLLCIAFFMASKYPLTKVMHNKLNQYLDYQRGLTAEPSLTAGEIEEMKRKLI